MDSSNPGPLLGRFKAENAENILKAYRIVMDVKETGKSYILQLVEFESRYSASHSKGRPCHPKMGRWHIHLLPVSSGDPILF